MKRRNELKGKKNRRRELERNESKKGIKERTKRVRVKRKKQDKWGWKNSYHHLHIFKRQLRRKEGGGGSGVTK